MLALLLVACKPTEDSAEEIVESKAPPPEIVAYADPTSVDFGALGLTESLAKVVTIHNDGEGDISLTAVSENEDDLKAQGGFGVMIPPAGTTDVTLTWTPLTTQGLDTTVTFLVTGEGGTTAQMPVSVTGTVSAPSLEVSTTSIEFGAVGVGCDSKESFTVSNSGNEALVIDSLAVLDGIDEYYLTTPTGALTLPLTLDPGGSQEVEVHFIPTTDASIAAVVEVSSNDPVTPTAQVQVDGTGHIDGENSITFDVKTKNVTVIFALNAVAVFGDGVMDALPTFFDKLAESRAEYRVALITEMSGEVVGDVPYIDNSMTTEEALEVADDMLANAGGDNDYLLDTFDKAIPANRDWLLDESDEWLTSTLSLIAMNSDQEQSTGSYVTYVNDYYAYKEDPVDVQVDAISGETPRGCNVDGKFAEPADLLVQASAMTSGTFYSWCEDWVVGMETLAAAALSGQQRFTLTGTPADWSIEVYIDELRVTEGWTYNAEKLEVEFDDEHFPDVGSEVRIDYLMETDCSDV